MPCLFQSTLSVRRATHTLGCHTHFIFISIHALRKESDKISCGNDVTDDISIHALRKESDENDDRHSQDGPPISIHALRKESDTNISGKVDDHVTVFQSTLSVRRATNISGKVDDHVTDFNPRSP